MYSIKRFHATQAEYRSQKENFTQKNKMKKQLSPASWNGQKRTQSRAPNMDLNLLLQKTLNSFIQLQINILASY